MFYPFYAVRTTGEETVIVKGFHSERSAAAAVEYLIVASPDDTYEVRTAASVSQITR